MEKKTPLLGGNYNKMFSRFFQRAAFARSICLSSRGFTVQNTESGKRTAFLSHLLLIISTGTVTGILSKITLTGIQIQVVQTQQRPEKHDEQRNRSIHFKKLHFTRVYILFETYFAHKKENNSEPMNQEIYMSVFIEL